MLCQVIPYKSRKIFEQAQKSHNCLGPKENRGIRKPNERKSGISDAAVFKCREVLIASCPSGCIVSRLMMRRGARIRPSCAMVTVCK